MRQVVLNSLSRPVLVVSSSFPPNQSGSATVIHNLTNAFDPGSIVLAVNQSPKDRSSRGYTKHPLYFFMSNIRYSGQINKYWRMVQSPFAVRYLSKIARLHDCGAIVGVYPDATGIITACRAAEAVNLPFVAYLHDTIKESMYDTRFRAYGEKIQTEVFCKANLIFVMSHGISELFMNKYDIATVPLLHSYPEPIPENIDLPRSAEESGKYQALWSGNIYRININAARRVFNAVAEVDNLTLNMTTTMSTKTIRKLGLDMGKVNRKFYSNRVNYLRALSSQSFHILALDWPDESPVHKDELSTIFPTKTPEYLASGRPILVHCPGDYYLAKYFTERKCGIVITERSPRKLVEAIQRLLPQSEMTRDLIRNGLKAAKMFSIGNIAEVFQSNIEWVMMRRRP